MQNEIPLIIILVQAKRNKGLITLLLQQMVPPHLYPETALGSVYTFTHSKIIPRGLSHPPWLLGLNQTQTHYIASNSLIVVINILC